MKNYVKLIFHKKKKEEKKKIKTTEAIEKISERNINKDSIYIVT